MLTLITGGIKSGKSRYALDLAAQTAGSQAKCFVATAEPIDAEIKLRIERHQMERGPEWATRETPVYLAAALQDKNSSYHFIVIDCLTLWANNLLHYQNKRGLDIENEIRQFEEALKKINVPVAVVTNEVGLGVVPENPLSRRYIDLLGSLNQRIAKISDRVVFMVSGLPMEIQGKTL
jgi:adenosylcobinamide kinase / adenosylcobinamide-phosphate guanylyltransferase